MPIEDKKEELEIKDDDKDALEKDDKDIIDDDEGDDVDPETAQRAIIAAKAALEDSSRAEIVEQVVKIKRVSKVVKGGKNFSFNALVVAGDGRGKVGIGFGKSNEVVGAILKGTNEAKSRFTKISLKNDTIPHQVIGRFKSTRVILKPAGPGTGVIAGGPVRAMCDAVGIKNILTKSLGSRTACNVVKATLDGFLKLRIKKRG